MARWQGGREGMNPFEMKKCVDALQKECLNADAVMVCVLKGDVVYTKSYGKFLNQGRLMATMRKKLNGLAKPAAQ